MNNKYNLNFDEAMNYANEYFDIIEDNLEVIKSELKDDPEHLEVIFNQMKWDVDTMIELEDKAYEFLSNKSYQMFFNHVLLNNMYAMFVNEVLPGDDLSELEEYLEELEEERVVGEVTYMIDNFLEDEE